MFLAFQNSYVEISFKVVLGNGSYGWWLGHADEALMHGIGAPIKEN